MWYYFFFSIFFDFTYLYTGKVREVRKILEKIFLLKWWNINNFLAGTLEVTIFWYSVEEVIKRGIF